MSDLYDRDFYACANQQAALLRAGKLSDSDVANIAEEIDSMGRSEKRELGNWLNVLLMHLLKCGFSRTGEPVLGRSQSPTRATTWTIILPTPPASRLCFPRRC